MEKVFILTEASSKIGVGHVMRCYSLYEELIKRKLNPVFFISGGQGIYDQLQNINYKIVDWTDNSLDTIENSYCIVDSYLANNSCLKEISEKARKTLFIDDNNIRNYPRKNSVVVNPSLYGKDLPYNKDSQIKYLLGSDYIILREPFRKKTCKTINRDIQELTVSIGGTDVLNLTYKIFKTLLPLKEIKKNIILSENNPQYERIIIENDRTTSLFNNLNATEMKELILKSDIVISAGGQTCNELVQLSTPSIVLCVADNQINNVRAMTKNNFALELSIDNIYSELLNTIERLDFETRESFIQNMDKCDFSKGVSNILNNFMGEEGLK